MQYAVNSIEVSASVAPKLHSSATDRCIGVYLIARCNSRRKTYFAEYSQQSRSFYYSH